MAILDNLEAYIELEDKAITDWCDDCNTNPGEKCPDCGYTHNCQLTKIILVCYN